MPLWVAAALVALSAWFLGTHHLQIFSEAVNWDEFALMDRAQRSLHSGTIVGSGRPGLVTIMLVPFVRGCVDSIQSVLHARITWEFITAAYLAGVYCLVRAWFRHAGRAREGGVQGLLAVALLTFLPAFIVWSVQVRTDQAALATSVWGGVLLLSRGRRRALVSGLLFAVSVLCTQKGIYTLLLCVFMYSTASLNNVLAGRMTLTEMSRILALRIGLSGLAAIATVLVYLCFVPDAARLATDSFVASSLETMRFTRASQGYRIYTVHALRLVVHWACLAVLVGWTIAVLRRNEREEFALLATCWGLMALGACVAVIHGSSFPYFIMTAGLFPALGLTMALGRPLAMSGRWAWPLFVLIAGLAAAQGARESIEMLFDTQAEQRATLRLVNDSPLRNRRGYQVEGALFCMRDPDPIPPLFSAVINQKFYRSPEAATNAVAFISEFRNRPIAYVVESYRLRQFPLSVRGFLTEHYVWYNHSLMVAGFYRSPDESAPEVDVIVPGLYRWEPDPAWDAMSISVDGAPVLPMQVVALTKGAHRLDNPDGPAQGRLILADLPPVRREGYPAFYHSRQINQLGGWR